jgi:hypothetical protein
LRARPLLGPSARAAAPCTSPGRSLNIPSPIWWCAIASASFWSLPEGDSRISPLNYHSHILLLVYCELLAVFNHWIDKKDTAQNYYIIALDAAGV